MQTWLVVIPDYLRSDNYVFGPFTTDDDAAEWGRTNVGSSRAWFVAPMRSITDWKTT